MRIILLGAPGAGKGTQGEFIEKELGIPKLSTGDMLRAAVQSGSSVGQKIKTIIDAGEFVSDDIIMELIKERLEKDDCKNGCLFDGVPRNLAQAEAFVSAGIDIDYVIDIEVSDEEIVARLGGRRVHPGSGRVYHIEHNPPVIAGQDDITKEPLVQRNDDMPEIILKRLVTYHEQTEPVFAWYRERKEELGITVAHVQGIQPVDRIRDDIMTLLR